jgi:hypothetical protein
MKYSPGDKVKHVGKRATVLECINFDDPSDVRLQGFRYLLQHSGYTWSVVESALSPVTTKK